MRLFVGLGLPDAVARPLELIEAGVPGARWQTREQLHLTLRFIGEADGRDARMIDDALAGISAPGFTLALHGVGAFGGKNPKALWAGVRKSEALDHLARKVDGALRRAGFEPDARKFTPHVTLARLRGGHGPVLDWLTDHALYSGAEFMVRAFSLYSSLLTTDGSIYRVEQDYPLGE